MSDGTANDHAREQFAPAHARLGEAGVRVDRNGTPPGRAGLRLGAPSAG